MRLSPTLKISCVLQSVITCSASSLVSNSYIHDPVAQQTMTTDGKKAFDWPPLESNPEVFSDYLHKIGLSPAYAIGEVFGFDEELLGFLPQPIYGTIVAFERLKKDSDVQKGDVSLSESVDFYMDQTGTLDNACGIIACLHAVLNTCDTNIGDGSMVDPNSILGKFRTQTLGKTPAERCQALETSTEFKTAHKSFASKGQSATITNDQSKVLHHFVAFIVHNNKLIELDGTKRGPFVIDGDCTDVLRGSIAEIQKRLAAGEISEKLSMMTLNAAMM